MRNSIENNRLDWLDVLKCIVMFAVICGHAATGDTPDTLRYYIYAFHIPLFFMISGMTFYLQTEKHDMSIGGMFLNKCRTLLWPYLIFNLLVIPVWIVYFKLFDPGAGSVSGLLVAIAYSNPTWSSLPISASWFLTTLFLSLMVFYIIIRICRRKLLPIFIVSLILGIIGYVISRTDLNLLYPWHISTVPVAVMFLMFGYVFMKKKDWFEGLVFKFKKGSFRYYGSAFLWIAVTFFIAYFIARDNVKITMGLNHYGNFAFFIIAVLAFSIMFYVISMIVPAISPFRLVGRNTIVYLCLHELGIIAMNTLSPFTHMIVSQYPVLASLAIFIVLLPVAYVVERWLPFLTGRRKKSESPVNK
ncbi:MAG: acyltransferase family protein [Clostridia bacterium]|nr:acyltransferase family protein [Clostridia bacterium]